jgi:hypothetical protein
MQCPRKVAVDTSVPALVPIEGHTIGSLGTQEGTGRGELGLGSLSCLREEG